MNSQRCELFIHRSLSSDSWSLQVHADDWTLNIWDQMVHFWNILSDADIYFCNKINPLLLIALCLQFCVVHCWMFEMEHACQMWTPMCVNWCSIGVQCVKMSPVEHVTCYHWILQLHNKDQCCKFKQIHSIYGNGKQMKERDFTSWL